MPITHAIDRSRRRLVTAAQGDVTYLEIVAHLELERDDGGLPLSEFIDASLATVNSSAMEVQLIVDRLRSLGRQNALGPTAILVGDDVSYGVMRMLETLVEDVSDIRPFRGRDEAEEWLNAIPMPRPPAQDR
jgi:hypothetical protein